MSRVLIVPAAGIGSRLRAPEPKPLVPVAGRPMIDHVIERMRAAVDSVVVVAHPLSSALLRTHMAEEWTDRLLWDVIEQPSPTGMLDAILLAAAAVDRCSPRTVLVAWCDQSGILPATVERLLAAIEAPGEPALALPTVSQEHPYVHLLRDDGGRITAVLHRREGDRMPAVGDSDMGLFAMVRSTYFEDLPLYAREVVPGSATGERNFLPFIAWLARRKRVTTIPCTDPREAVGINTPDDLAFVEAWLRERRADVR